jgi:hypothetical protein
MTGVSSQTYLRVGHFKLCHFKRFFKTGDGVNIRVSYPETGIDDNTSFYFSSFDFSFNPSFI